MSRSYQQITSEIASLQEKKESVLHRQEERVKEVKQEFASELGGLDTQLSSVNQELEKLPIEDWVEQADLPMPEVISLWGRGDERVVFLRSPQAPEYAFMVFAQEHRSTWYQLTLQLTEEQVSRSFSVCCGCCPFGLPPEFGEKFDQVCEANGIETVFLRQAEHWSSQFPSTTTMLVEGSEFYDLMLKRFSHDQIREIFSWIGFGTELPAGEHSRSIVSWLRWQIED